jgi:TonB family protein
MEAFAGYLFRSAVWLAGFAIVYFLFLRNERFFRIKRWFLITGIVISFLLPLIRIHYQVELPSPAFNQTDQFQALGTAPSGVQQSFTASKFDFRVILLAIYFAGVTFLLFRVFAHVWSLYKMIHKSGIIDKGGAKLVKNSYFSASFSFFKYIFINPSVSETEAGEILNHELVHIRQRHWLDLLLAEMLRMFQWVNPFAWIYTAFIRLNHEYLADEVALQRTSNPAIYRAALVNQLFSSPVISFSNSFNYSLNKKRFEMMKKIITSPYRKLKVLFVLPVFAIVLYAFAMPEYHYTESAKSDMSITNASEIIAGVVKGTIVNGENKGMIGVTVIVSGATIGTISDQNGRFAIGNVPEGSTLKFSYEGYKSLTLNPDFSKEMTVKMEQDTENPGQTRIRVVQAAANPQDQTPPPSPLLLVDGAISNKGIGEIDPNNINSITVLKDKSATELYGEKGKNGVILVTLKSQATPGVQQVVKGIVLNEDGTPLPGVSIVNTGTLGNVRAAQTGADGRFTLQEVQPDAILMLSCPGYKWQNVKPSFTTEMKVIMAKDPEYKAPSVSQVQSRPAPAIAIDGVIVDKSMTDVRKDLGYNYGTTQMLPSQAATEKYGEKGKNGVYEIMTREKAKAMGIKTPFPRLSPDDYPTFQGKPSGYFNDWVLSQVKYPTDATAKGIQGLVNISFIVQLDGSITDIKISGTADPILANELISVVKTSPNWDIPKNTAVDAPYEGMVYARFTLPDKITNDVPFVVVEQMPQYPGGEGELLKFIASNTKYPEQAKANKSQGRVIVRFAVTPEGNISDPSVLKSVDPLLDAEALRVVSLLKGWNPGKQGGKAVYVWYMVPITFALNLDVAPK